MINLQNYDLNDYENDENDEAAKKAWENQAFSKDLTVFTMAIKFIFNLLSCHEHDNQGESVYVFVNMLLKVHFSLQILLFGRTGRWQGPTSKSAGGSDCFAGHKKLASLLWGFRNRATPWEGTTNLRVPLLLGQQK